jgi:hypothetical protein
MVLTSQYLQQGIRDATSSKNGFNILQLSCHGNDNGIQVGGGDFLTWPDFVRLFRDEAGEVPAALVMSSCCGATSGIVEAFEASTKRPQIIFGSPESLEYSDYCTAWSILYHRAKTDGISPDTTNTALEQINAVLRQDFLCWRMDYKHTRYERYPRSGASFEVVELVHPAVEIAGRVGIVGRRNRAHLHQTLA